VCRCPPAPSPLIQLVKQSPIHPHALTRVCILTLVHLSNACFLGAKAYIADAESKWSEWFGDSVVLNTGCLWTDATSDQGAKELATARNAYFQTLRGKETKDAKA